jgi:4-amino-4-deoxy-L-arabinose transferase-like glycosyltransferase
MKSGPDSSMPSPTIAERPWAFGLLLFIFAAALLVILPNYHAYFFGDEHFYTDSAIRMAQTGQILTPAYADGAPRFNKPVLSYWMILSSFHTFGISVLSSRLPSLAAGVLILILTGLLSHRLFASRSAAFTAMLILASNSSFMSASMRATPDIFLCLTALLSLIGFAGLLLNEKPGQADAWCAYLGAGLAVAAKGMLGLLLVAFAFLFALSRRDRNVKLRTLIRPLPMVLGLVVALAWFVAVYMKYHDVALNGFLQDQVGTRVSSSFGKAASNLVSYTVGLVVPFFPFSLLLLAGALLERRTLRHILVEQAPAFLFILGWYLLLVAVFTPANLTRTRYLLPAFPLLAVGLGRLLNACLALPAIERTTIRLLQALSLLLIPAAALLAWLGWVLERPLGGAGAVALLVCAAVIAWTLLRPSRFRLGILLAFAPFMIIWTGHGLIRPLFPSTPAYRIARTLAESGVTRVYFPKQSADMPYAEWDRYKEKIASQIRLISGATVRVDRLDLERYVLDARTLPMICAGSERSRFPPDRFRAVRAGSVFKDPTRSDLRAFLAAPDKKKAFRSCLEPYYIMFPVNPQPAAVPSG